MYALSKNVAPTLSERLPKSYEEAAAMLGGRASKKLANNTYLVAREVRGGEGSRRINDGIEYAVRLHETDVVTFVSKSETRLDSGNYQTPTTRSRMRACGFPVYMAGGIATVAPDGPDSDSEATFADGMLIVRDSPRGGTVVYYAPENVRPHDAARRMRREDLRKNADAWRWPNRSGGRGYERGNAPQAFWKLP